MSTKNHKANETLNDNGLATNLPTAEDAAAAVGMLVQLAQGWPVKDPLTVQERRVVDKRIAKMGTAAVKRAAQIAAEHGGIVANVAVDAPVVEAVLEYAREYGPVALRALELGHRIQDDIRARMAGVTQRTQLAIQSMRLLSKEDKTLLPYLHDLEALRPRHTTRRARAKAPAASQTAPASAPNPQSVPSAKPTEAASTPASGGHNEALTNVNGPYLASSSTSGTTTSAPATPSAPAMIAPPNGASNGAAKLTV